MENFLHLNSELYQALVEFPEGATISDLAEMIGLSQDQLIEQLQVLIKLSTEKEDLYNYAFGADKLLFKSLKESDPVKLLELANFLILPADLRKKLQIQIGVPETIKELITDTAIDFDDPHFWVKVGNLDGLKKTFKNPDSVITMDAASCGSLDCLSWAIKNGCLVDENVIAAAALKGHTEIVHWLHEQGCPWNDLATEYAALSGDFELVKWLHRSGCPSNQLVMEIAADHEKYEFILWARENGIPWSVGCYTPAIKNGDLERIKWFYQLGCLMNKRLTLLAVCYNQFEILQWFHEHGCPLHDSCCNMAVKQNNFAILEWLHQNGAKWDNDIRWDWDQSTFEDAAMRGNLEIFKWLIANDCPMPDEFIAHHVAPWEHMHILEWLAEQNMLDESLYWGAPNDAMLEWAIEHGCPWSTNTTRVAAATGNLNLLKWLKINGCPWDQKVCQYAAMYGKLECLQWAHDEGCPWDQSTCSGAAQGDSLKCLIWAHDHGCPWDPLECLGLSPDSSATRNWILKRLKRKKH